MTRFQSQTFPLSKVYEGCPLDKTSTSAKPIRLIELLPGESSQGLQCRLYPSYIEKDTQYTALSYVWGDESVLTPISVNGQIFGITRNLHSALFYLRQRHVSRILWVDAVCINQQDDVEKAQQVSQMTAVFQTARDVLAWLGEDEQTVEAMQYLSLDGTMGYYDPRKTSQALVTISENPYWSRIWVVQEATLASRLTFQSKHCVVEDTIITKGLTQELRQGKPAHPNLWRCLNFLRIVHDDHGSVEHAWAARCLRDASELSATVEVDKIYGLLGVLPEALRQQVVVDYSQSFDQVTHGLTKAYIELYLSLDILHEFQPLSHDPRFRHCPSWLPDFRNKLSGIAEGLNSSAAKSSCKAMIVYNQLITNGMIVGRIDAVRGPLTNRLSSLAERFKNDEPRLLQEIEHLGISVLRRLHPDLTIDGLQRDFLEVLCGGKIHHRFASGSSASLWQSMLEIESSGRLDVPSQTRTDLEALFSRIQRKTFFTTSNDHIGLGPGDVRENDLMCTLYGCPVPVVLRENMANGQRTYKFIGRAISKGSTMSDLVRRMDGLSVGLTDETVFHIE